MVLLYEYTSSSANLSWINASTGETYRTPQTANNYSPGTAYLKKIPNQPYLYAYSNDVSPTGLYVFDIDTKAFKSYKHVTMGNVWFFKQAELMATGYSYIIRTAEVIAAAGNQLQGPSSIGELKAETNRYPSWWIDCCEASHSIFTILSYYTHSYYPPVKGKIYQFEDNDYTLVKTHTYDYLFQPDVQTAPYEVEARYVFSNSAGTELSVLRKGANNNLWSIEFMPIP